MFYWYPDVYPIFTSDSFSISLGSCDTNPCFPGVICRNIDKAGFKCEDCPPGYVGDGKNCTDIDEVPFSFNYNILYRTKISLDESDENSVRWWNHCPKDFVSHMLVPKSSKVGQKMAKVWMNYENFVQRNIWPTNIFPIRYYLKGNDLNYIFRLWQMIARSLWWKFQKVVLW